MRRLAPSAVAPALVLTAALLVGTGGPADAQTTARVAPVRVQLAGQLPHPGAGASATQLLAVESALHAHRAALLVRRRAVAAAVGATARAARQREADDLAVLVATDQLRWQRLQAPAPAAGPVLDPTPGVPAGPRAAAVVAYALAQVGDPYVWGATGPDAWDCSGLVRAAYASIGIGLPRTSREQFWAGVPIARDALRPADLVFLAHDPADPATIHHVALYLGNGLVVEAARPGSPVRVASLMADGYAGAVRILENDPS